MEAGARYFGRHHMFKYGFNISPMYRRSTGRIKSVSKDMLNISMKLPISYKNRNYANTIFGGSMFSAVDPIPMVQLINILGNDYVVWDKSAEVFFKRPAKTHLYANFEYTPEEIEDIKARVKQNNEIEIIKITQLTDITQEKVFCEVKKTIYIANKAYYKQKRSLKDKRQSITTTLL